MFVERVMTAPVVTAGPRTTVAQAQALLEGRLARHLPVVENGALVGIVSDGDLRVASARPKRADGSERTVGLIMNRSVVTAGVGTPIEEASRLMLEHKIGALPLVNGARLIGIVTRSDLLRVLGLMVGLIEPATRLELEAKAEAAFGGGACEALGEGWPSPGWAVMPQLVGRD